MLAVHHVTDRVVTTVMSVTTEKLFSTMENVWLTVQTMLITTKQPMNAEVFEARCDLHFFKHV